MSGIDSGQYFWIKTDQKSAPVSGEKRWDGGPVPPGPGTHLFGRFSADFSILGGLGMGGGERGAMTQAFSK